MQKFTVNNTEYSIRLFDVQNDSVEELTDLLHRAYKPLADKGLNFIATHQSVEYTRNYFRKGECYILVNPENKICGTIFYYLQTFHDAPEIFKDNDTVLFGKFAVEPSLQKAGIGPALTGTRREGIRGKNLLRCREALCAGGHQRRVVVQNPASHH